MRLQVQADLLKDALSRLLPIVDKRSARPILGNILLIAKNNQLELSATDLEISAKSIVTASVENEGSFCVNAQNISDILRELSGISIINLEMDSENNIIRIFFEDIHFSLIGFSNSEYPQLFFNKNKDSFCITSANMLDFISKTSHAISTDETRLFLNGLYLQQMDCKLRVVATDGYRLSLVDYEFEKENIDYLNNGIIIPKKGVTELKRMAEAYPEKEILLSVDESFIYASMDNKEFLSVRLIAREYPKYQTVIPSKVAFTVVVDRNLFLNALRRVRIMSNEKTSGIKVQLSKNEIQIRANHPSLGKAFERMPVDYNGNEMELGLNAKFLIDILLTMDEGDILLELNNEFGPVLVKSYNAPNCLGLIMPLKI